jgi:predicted transcriptional regulator
MKKYDLVAKIRRSSIKTKILESLKEPKTATDLKKDLNIHRESISRALLEMQKDGLVICVNPEQPNYRYYKKTKKRINFTE